LLLYLTLLICAPNVENYFAHQGLQLRGSYIGIKLGNMRTAKQLKHGKLDKKLCLLVNRRNFGPRKHF
jgi:hypothetical protein